MEDEGAQEVVNAPIVNSSVPGGLIQATTAEKKTHTIPDFLNRLYEIDNFTWKTTDTRGTVLKTYRFPDVLLNNPAILAKTRNFFGFRAGVEFVVLINKQPFQAGNLLISFLPNARYNKVKLATHKHLMGIVSRSGSPRTNLDLMDGTRATLTVPYVSPFIFYNLISKTGTIGDFFISVYSPLADVAAAGTVSVQVMARFVDIELEFPTGVTPAETLADQIGICMDNYYNTKSREDIAEARQKLDELLTKMDHGFKLQMNTQCINIKQKALPNMTNSDGANHAHVLAISGANTLRPSGMGHTKKREMEFKEILSIPVFHNTFQIKTTDAAGKNVFSTLVGPTITPNVSSTNGLVAVDYFNMVAHPFQKWRGSINYLFRAVKTQFHSLRIRVWFCPATATATGVDRNAIISKIIDLKELNQFDFECPYIWPQPWLDTRTGDVSLGVLGVDILNAMVAPSSVSDTIDFIVERSMGSDFAVNLPINISYSPADLNTLPPSEFHLQMGDTNNVTDDTTFERPESSSIADGLTMGAEINTIDQMIQRSTQFLRDSYQIPFYKYDFTLVAGTGSIVLDDALSQYSWSDTPFGTFNFPNIPGHGMVLPASKFFAAIAPTGDTVLLQPLTYLISIETDYWQITVNDPSVIDYNKYKLVTAVPSLTELTTEAFPTPTITNIQPLNNKSLAIFPHTFPTATLVDDVWHEPTFDPISYFAHMYTFYRGGFNLRIGADGSPYSAILNPGYSGVDDTTGPSVRNASNSLYSLGSLVTQLIQPAVEGFGEINIPYYSESYCSSIGENTDFMPGQSIASQNTPPTSIFISPRGDLRSVVIYRAALKDFEFSYLSGPPIMH